MPLPIETATVEVQSDALMIPAYLAHPSTLGKFPIVVVIQEVFGVNAHIREVTNRLAQEGYIAIAPHIYHRQVKGFDVGYDDSGLALGRTYKVGTKADELLNDVQGAIIYVKEHFDDVPVGVGCIGFCFGGHVAYLAATLSDVRATASFYGAGIVSSTPGGGLPTIERTPEISGTIYAFFGMEDPLIPLSEVDKIEAALRQATVKSRIFRYPNAGHGFFCDHRKNYHPPSAKDAWEHVKSLFSDELQSAQ